MAREMGSPAIRLHPLPAMVEAGHLYRSMGFVAMAPTIGSSAYRGDTVMELRFPQGSAAPKRPAACAPYLQGG